MVSACDETLAEHDARHHPDGFDYQAYKEGKITCEFRDRRAALDPVDTDLAEGGIGGIYTGSSADYKRASLDWIGSGVGENDFGHGLYGSDSRDLANTYADNLAFRSGRRGSYSRLSIDGEPIRVGFGDPDRLSAAMATEAVTIGDIEKRIYDRLSEPGDEDENTRNKLKAALDFIRENKERLSLANGNGIVYEQTYFTNRAKGDEAHLLNSEQPIGRFLFDLIDKQATAEGVDVSSVGITKESCGASVYGAIRKLYGGKGASEFLARADVDGIKYPARFDSYANKIDGLENRWNYVSFRDDNIRTDRVWVDGMEMDVKDSIALDSVVSMEEHDAQYHGGKYDPDTMKCSLRDNDKADERLCGFRGRAAENEGVRSYVTKAVKDGKKWKEDRSKKDDHSQWIAKGKHDKWYSIPDPKDAAETPNLDSFADVPAMDETIMSQIDDSKLYRRGAATGSKDGAAFDWTIGGQPIPPEDAARLEAALREAGFTSAVNPDYTNVSVRPDLVNGNGQMTRFTNKTGEVHNDYSDRHKIEQAKEKYRHVNVLMDHYDDLKMKIFNDCLKGDEDAILAYFMMRTKIRAGSKKDTDGGIGAADLCKGDISLSDDGETFYASFNGKSKQWWHVTCKDKFLYDYLKGRKGAIAGPGANSEPMFPGGYAHLNAYLGRISDEIGCPEKFSPHDFRRVGATRVAMQYLEKELKGVDPVKDRKKWEDRIVKAVVAAAQHLNDKPKTVFTNYIAPNILFASSPEDEKRYFPQLFA